MINIKKSGLKLFRNGAGKKFIEKLCELICCDDMLVKTSTTTDSVSDWCGYPPVESVETIKDKADYIKLLSGMILDSKVVVLFFFNLMSILRGS